MAFELLHPLVSERFTPRKITEGEFAFFKVSERGEFPVFFPGRLNRGAQATFNHRFRFADTSSGGSGGPGGPEGPDEPGTTPLHGGVVTTTKIIPLTMRVFTPDGREFTKTDITLADLRKHRDLRGSPSGLWTFTVTGESEHIFIDEDSSVLGAKGTLSVSIKETVASESAPPLVNNVAISSAVQKVTFDLFRVGTFVAEISQLLLGAAWKGSMRLLDPDGVAVARTTTKKLSFAVELRTLGKSRDALGRVRKWTLEITPQGGTAFGKPRVSATVIGTGRITITALKGRIDTLLGPRGKFISVFGENKGGIALGRLKITDVVSAETIDMHGLLDGVLDADKQDGNANPKDIQANVVYTLGRKSESLKAGLKLEVKTLKVGTIDVVIGPGVKLGPSIPAVRLKVAVSGAAKITFKGLTLATGKVRGGKLEMEIGMKLGTDGTPRIVKFVPDSAFDIDISTAVKAALLATLGLAGLIGGLSVSEYVEHEINEAIVAGARRLLSDPNIGPSILMTIFGAHLTHKPVRIVGDEIVFDHVAPLEPDPKPTPGYLGAVGRTFLNLGPNAMTFKPPLLGDTWASDNMNAKIDHIVVVMMENRSYDHVLGHRAQAPFNDGADGLTEDLIAKIEAAENGPFDVRKLREAGFEKNAAGLMTRLPKGVGHELSDVAEQLAIRATGPGGGSINSPKGFVDNFTPRLASNPLGVVANDVLGFYDEKDLVFYAYLAENYAYCDRFFCSHPGPTLPNRMISLTGDVQHDRYGFPILDNNNSDNFLLSRAATIYDFMARKGLSFRVYESFPSVTMLRFFARYATDLVNIVPIDRLAADVARGDLPAFTAIEPQMHAHPQDDDHPDADMLRGQIFVKRVYDTLRSNPALWQRTLLIVTYDEHGGLYDHVVPPLADVLTTAGPGADPGFGGGLSGATATTGTAVRRSRAGRPLPASILSGAAVVTATVTTPPAGTAGATTTTHGLGTANLPTGPLLELQRIPEVLQIPYGVRVPTFVVSPWTPRGKGPNVILDHCSILKSVLARFFGNERPFLSDRVHVSFSFDAFLTEATPRMNVPASPSLPSLSIGVRRAPSLTTKIITPPLSRQKMRQGPVDYHELSGRWARQLGR